MFMDIKSDLINIYEKLIKKRFITDAEKKIIEFEALDSQAKQEARAEKLLTILKRAYEEVPYYNALFDRNKLRFSNPLSLADFMKIPILTKKIIRDNFEEIKSKQIDKTRWIYSNTSGSTGDPLIFIIDQEFSDIKLALANYQYKENNLKEDNTLIKLWVLFRDIDKSTGMIKHMAGNWLRNRIELDSRYMSDEIMGLFVKKIKSKKSVFIDAYAQSAYELAKFINKNGISINNVTAITSTVSTLFDFMRAEIEKAFNCPVFNRYGSREASVIAFERNDADGLKVSTSQYIVEVINENGQHCNPGEEGDVIITNFSNFVFPFIRYNIGDRAVVKTTEDYPVKSCLSLEKISGRVSDIFIKEDGSFVNSHYFAHVIGQSINSGWIDKMQIIQLEYKKVQINIVKIDKYPEPESEIRLMRMAIQKVMGEDCQVDFNFVDQIDTSRSGKYQYVRSLVNKKELPINS